MASEVRKLWAVRKSVSLETKLRDTSVFFQTLLWRLPERLGDFDFKTSPVRWPLELCLPGQLPLSHPLWRFL